MLVTSVLCNNSTVAAGVVTEALAAGTDAIELRIDAWDDESTVERLAHLLPPRRWIVTCRATGEGGHCEGDAAHRAARLVAAGGGDGYIDFEFADWRRSADARQKLRLAAGVPADRPGEGGPGLILSSHHLDGRPQDPAGLLAAMASEADAGAVKLVWQAEDIRDNFIALELLRATRKPTIALCMGEAGLPSRVLARKFGAFATYCSPAAGQETAPGQVTLGEMLERYRWRSITSSTEVYGVIGFPVAQSMSPALFNALFDRHGINAVYLPLPVDPSPDVLAAFLEGCRLRPWLDVRGFSVTSPHKRAAARWLGNDVSSRARRIGAVNTLRAEDGRYVGYNTDCAGALDAITGALDCGQEDLSGLGVEILGAGGAARAVVVGLRDCGCDVTVCNRHQSRGRALAEEFGCRSKPWESRGLDRDVRLLINCTSVGMWPDVEGTPMPADRLREDCIVFDLVYNPIQTRLLRDARRAGCRIIDGLSMFVNQAATQFNLWTSTWAGRSFMRATVEAELEKVGSS
jgi:3-dehydroquinate dehydratase/shikimate dehydrogenase